MKNLLRICLLLYSLPLWGQNQSARSFVVGGVLGFESQMLGIQTLDGLEPARTAVLSERPGLGFGVGGFGQWPLWLGIAVRQGLTVTFSQNTVLFRPEERVKYHFAGVELPLHFVLTNRSKGRFPLRGSFLFGGRLGWNLTPNATDNLHLLRERAALDIGLGIEIRKGGWRIQPELVYSRGMNNLHDFNNSRYDWLVGQVIWDKLSLRVVTWKGAE